MTIENRNTVILAILFVIVCLPRFDRNDFLISGVVGGGQPNDSMHYVSMADIYRGMNSEFEPQAPFTYRPLIPFLASVIPIPSMTGINVLNLIFLFSGVYLLGRLIRDLGATEYQRLVILVIFIFSFPVFYYGSIGYVDPAVIGLLGAGCFLIHRRFDFALVLVLFLGTFVKETILLLIPVFMVYAVLYRSNRLKSFLTFVVLIVVYLVGMSLARRISLDPTREFWSPSLETLLDNVARIRTWASFILSFGIPGLLSAVALMTVLVKKRWDAFLAILPWLVGILASLALFVLSMLTAYSDGRFIWPATVFALPIILNFWQLLEKKFQSPKFVL